VTPYVRSNIELPPAILERVAATVPPLALVHAEHAGPSPFADDVDTWLVYAIVDDRFIRMTFMPNAPEGVIKEQISGCRRSDIQKVEVNDDLATVYVNDMDGVWSTGVPVEVAQGLLRGQLHDPSDSGSTD
jgi:hypothetical protein